MFNVRFNDNTITQTSNPFILFDCEGYALSEPFYRIETERLVFKFVQFSLGSHFQLAAHLGGKVNHLKSQNFSAWLMLVLI